jgi:hypothetical protein
MRRFGLDVEVLAIFFTYTRDAGVDEILDSCNKLQ